MLLVFFFLEWYGDHRDLHVLTHSFPTRRSSDLRERNGAAGLPAMRARIASATWRPICLAAGATPGTGLPSCCTEARSPATNTSGMPGTARSASTGTRSEDHTSELQSLILFSFSFFFF